MLHVCSFKIRIADYPHITGQSGSDININIHGSRFARKPNFSLTYVAFNRQYISPPTYIKLTTHLSTFLPGHVFLKHLAQICSFSWYNIVHYSINNHVREIIVREKW